MQGPRFNQHKGDWGRVVLFWLAVLQVSVHGQLASCFQSFGEVIEQHKADCSPHGSQEAKVEEAGVTQASACHRVHYRDETDRILSP